uniref:Transmembrane protein n=1 Tax=Ascaris lumbricoides TaxID=6252 RepID=A0A0M3IGA9_ASCLU
MTKPDFSGNKPKTQEQGAQDNGEPTEKTADDQNEVKKNSKAEERRIQDVLTAIGMDVSSESSDTSRPRYVGIDWAFILRIANMQAVLSVMSVLCLSTSMLLTGFNFYRFTSSAWATYLLSCAYIGMRAGRWQSYAHAIAFCGMCTFQTLVYMSTMCWLVYSVYAIDAHSQLYYAVHHNVADLVLLLTLGEVLSIMGTVLTGVLGLIGCCRGFGRLLHAQEKMIMVCLLFA